MNEPTNICPLMCIAQNGGICIEARCAFWICAENECSIHAIASALKDISLCGGN